MANFFIALESNLAGKTLEELKIRESFGINKATIRRGEITINIPKSSERLFPGDEISIIGTDEQVELFKNYLVKNEIEDPEDVDKEEIILQQLELKDRVCIGKSIRESMIREKTHSIIVGIERDGERILNPNSNLILQSDDILWLAGNKKKIKYFLKQ